MGETDRQTEAAPGSKGLCGGERERQTDRQRQRFESAMASGPVDHGREPCPHRILDDCGSAFGMGAVGGGVWYLVKGLKNSPPGARMKGALEAIRRESPRLGGSFAVW